MTTEKNVDLRKALGKRMRGSTARRKSRQKRILRLGILGGPQKNRRARRQLSVKDRNVFQQIYDYIVRAIKNATGDAELRQLNAIKENFDKAYRELGETPENIAVERKYSRRKASKRNLDDMTSSDYNNHGWVAANNLVSDEKMADFMGKIGDKERSKADWYGDIGDGKHIIAVHEKDGANNTLIVTNGDYHKPSIERVYDIALESDTDVEIVRDAIYELERHNKGRTTSEVVDEFFKDEPVRCISKEDSKTYREFKQARERAKGEGNQRNVDEMRDLGRSRSNDREDVTEPPKGGSLNGDVKYSRSKNPPTAKRKDVSRFAEARPEITSRSPPISATMEPSEDRAGRKETKP